MDCVTCYLSHPETPGGILAFGCVVCQPIHACSSDNGQWAQYCKQEVFKFNPCSTALFWLAVQR